jgi:hypothetical protein
MLRPSEKQSTGQELITNFMIRKKVKRYEPHIVLDLTGPEGNAFYLIGVAQKLATQLEYTKDKIESLTKDLMSGDYENLITRFDNEFGEYVILER